MPRRSGWTVPNRHELSERLAPIVAELLALELDDLATGVTPPAPAEIARIAGQTARSVGGIFPASPFLHDGFSLDLSRRE